ncbi:hypothetical protein [Streptomyces armeniacus]|uniref:hypothetical protein n=1 Tax=Streptomyces armeniacus TaxID=83291 RepID=UPI001AD7F29B|nr:hypothetical protein [Streptomyces armeniacus]
MTHTQHGSREDELEHQPGRPYRRRHRRRRGPGAEQGAGARGAAAHWKAANEAAGGPVYGRLIKITAADGTFTAEEIDAQLTPYFADRDPHRTFVARSVADLDPDRARLPTS